MKLLALDIDGVLNSAKYLRDNPGSFDRRDWINHLDPAACARLAEIVRRTDCHILISSRAWRINCTMTEMSTLLSRRGVNARIVGATSSSRKERGDEILDWLDAWHEKNDRAVIFRETLESLAILDDGSDMASLQHRLVRTTWDLGLQDEHVERVVAMLNEP